jgi:uncharacterized protein (TIGR03437 family)
VDLVKIGVVGDVTTDSRQITSLAYDSSTNTFAVASEASDPQGGTDIQLYVSTDGGARPFPATPSARQTGDIIQLFGNALASATSGVTISSESTISPAPTVGGANANVQYAGLVVTGLFQLNIVVPSVPSVDQPMVVSTGGQSSQTGVLVPIQ